MKNKFTLLGSGSSLGSPWIDGYWGSCNKYEKKNYRTRCAAHIRYKNLSILLFTTCLLSLIRAFIRGFNFFLRPIFLIRALILGLNFFLSIISQKF